MKINSLKIINVTRVITASSFMMSVLILYLQSKGLSSTEALTLLGYYSILNIVLEIPTGLIGDHFSHKLSTQLSYFFYCLFTLLLAIDGSLIYYYVVMTIAGLAASFMSGSDDALFNAYSKDYKKDYPKLSSVMNIWRVVTISVGGLLAGISLSLPLYATTFFYVLAFILLFFVKPEDKKEVDIESKDFSGNIFGRALEGIKLILKSPELLSFLILTIITSGFFLSMKWFANPLFTDLSIPVAYWGFLLSSIYLFTSIGNWIAGKYPKIDLRFNLIVMVIGILLMAVTQSIVISLIGFAIVGVIRGFIESQISVGINEHSKDYIRATINSTKGLLTRVGSSFFIFLAGIALTKTSISVFLVFTAIVIGVASLVFVVKTGMKTR